MRPPPEYQLTDAERQHMATRRPPPRTRPDLDPADVGELSGLRVEGPAIGIVGCIAVALADQFTDFDTAVAAGMGVYRKLCDAGYVTRQL